MVPQTLDSLISNHAISISVHVQYQCFHYAVTWENDHQRSQKITIKWNWCSNGFNSLVSDYFDCFYDLDHKKCTITPCSKSEFSLRHDEKKLVVQNTQGVQKLLLLWNITPKGLTNHIRNIPKEHIHRVTGRILVFVTPWRKIQAARWSLTFPGNHICKRIDLD